MAEITDLIRKIDFFANLEPKIVRKIADVCIPREYSKDDYIIRQGETGLGLFFIVSGRVKVEVENNGDRSVVAELKEEDFFGELSIIDNKPRSANIICQENTRCLLLTRDSFSKLINAYPEIAIQMAKGLAERLRATTEKVSSRAAGASGPATSGQQAASSSDTQTGPGAPPPAGPADTSRSDQNGGSTKTQIRDFLVNTFKSFYTVKAFTRFSVAVVGCPVQVHVDPGGGRCFTAELGEVRLAILPSSRDQVLTLTATGEGRVSITVLRPAASKGGSPLVSRFEDQVLQGQRLRLHLPSGRAASTRLEP